jgi:hypothetical protein
MISTDEGIQIDESNKQAANADLSIRESLESDSNLTFERLRHRMKHDSQMMSTDEGIQIDESEEQSSNADFSIRESLESDSKVTFERLGHLLKQDSQMISTVEGIQTQFCPTPAASISITFDPSSQSLTLKTRPAKQTRRLPNAPAPNFRPMQ